MAYTPYQSLLRKENTMGMKSMYELRDMLCKELDELIRKGELGAGDLDIAHKLTDTIKNIDKIEAMDERGYSGRYLDDDLRGYSRGSSYARRHYVRGHYSRDDGRETMRRQLRDMLDDADDDTIRSAIQRCMDAVEG